MAYKWNRAVYREVPVTVPVDGKGELPLVVGLESDRLFLRAKGFRKGLEVSYKELFAALSAGPLTTNPPAPDDTTEELNTQSDDDICDEDECDSEEDEECDLKSPLDCPKHAGPGK